MKNNSKDGFIIPAVLGYLSFFILMMTVLVTLLSTNLFVVRNNNERQKALDIAESGVNYYLWHLSHNSSDVTDGNPLPATPPGPDGYGPYKHDYIDSNGVKRGSYTLWLKPQGNGSTITNIRSTGEVDGSSSQRTIEAQVGVPSFASYNVVSDQMLWFGNTESASGPVHSNIGVRMDGASTGDVTSANSTYVPSSSLGGNGITARPGVWCSTSITTPVNCNTRSKADWRFPVPIVDFNQVNGSLCTIKKRAFASDASTQSLSTAANACDQTPTVRTAAYLPQLNSTGAYSINRGYYIQLNNDNTYTLSQVTDERDSKPTISAALNTSAIQTNIPIPATGVIFVEDNVWIRTSNINGFEGRVTVASARLASNATTNITIVGNILYGQKDGSDSIGLIAEKSVLIAPYAPPNNGSFLFEINAALIAVTGSVQYPYTYKEFPSRCARGWSSSNQNFLFYGSVASRSSWTWLWTRGSACGDNTYGNGSWNTGFLNSSTQYDYNLYYAPPPSYPVTNGYNVISWRESVKR